MNMSMRDIDNHIADEHTGERVQFDESMSIEEFKELAMERYEQGGHRLIECWDNEMITEWLAEEGRKYYDIFDLIDLMNY